MRKFTDESGREWIAGTAREKTMRHHSLYYLVFKSAAGGEDEYPVPEIRWQTAATGDRTLRTMSEFDLRRRLKGALVRNAAV